MPLYRFECVECQKEVVHACSYSERHEQVCPCGRGAMMNVLPSMPATRIFKRGFYEHVSHEGAWIDSAADLEKVCRENNAVSPYLEDSPYRRAFKTREI